jgi:hypothetical protein
MGNKRHLGLASTLVVSMIAGCSAPLTQPLADGTAQALSQPFQALAPNLPKASGVRPATLFAYVAMDDGLSPMAEKFINAIESTSTPRIYDVAFTDFQGPDNSYLWYLGQDRDPAKPTSPHSFLSPQTKEVSANDPANVAATVNWAYSNYPGTFKAMDVLAHGGGFFGLGTDATQVGKKRWIMNVAEFGNALRSGLKGRKLNLINMLSCLMGNVEYAYELRDVTDVLIASEDSIQASDDTTLAFTAELNKQLSGPTLDARTIARNMAIFGNAKNPNSGYLTISALDLTRIDEVKRSVTVLSNALLRAMPSQGAEIVKAYDAVPALKDSMFGEQRDLWAFCNQLQQVNNPTVRQAALATKAALKQAILYTRDKEGAAANGLSICMPTRAAYAEIQAMPMLKDAFEASLNSRFAKGTSWAQFITTMCKTAP